MVTRLGELAVRGLRDPREVLGPFVELLIEQRRGAREEHRFEDADDLRRALEGLGVELRDDRGSTVWLLVEEEPGDRTPREPE
jgi:cysteinyl-tRNA synthetase